MLVVARVIALVRPHVAPHGRRDAAPDDAMPCFEEEGGCGGREAPPPLAAEPRGTSVGPVLRAADVCRNAGYLCAEVAAAGEIRIRRWRDGTGTLVVGVPRPKS